MPTTAPRPAAITPAEMRRKRTMRRVAGAVLLLCVLVVAGAIAARLWLRNAISAGIPSMDGSLHLSGLIEPVSVRRDAYGVPHIQARSEDDLLRAQGYVTAQDRLWQMDMLRRHAAGELAEVLGRSMLDHDRTQRYLQLRAVADRSVAELDPADLHALQQYADGVNAAIRAADPLPAEFRVLGYTPRPWTPRDSLLVGFAMAEDLSTSYPNKLNREAVQARLPADLAAALYPTSTFRDHPPAEGRKDLSAPREMIEIPLDPSQSELRTPQHLQDLQQANAIIAQSVSGQRCESCAAGSNNWVVSGARTASGKPMLANDMHLTISVPGIWYSAELHAPGIDVGGVTLPGVPYVIAGHNSHVAWGFTNSTADVQDLYIEQRNGDTFRDADGSTQPIEHRRETIHVKHGLDTTLDIAFTRHGSVATPIISPLFPHEKRTLALRWTLYEPHFAAVPFRAANHATNGADLVAAFADFGGPSQNLVWGDDGGHIGYHLIGFVPLRINPQGPASAPAYPDATPAVGPESNPNDLPESNAIAASTGPADASANAPTPFAAAEPAPLNSFGKFILPSTPVPTGTAEWTGRITYTDLPAVTDPAGGALATANARITSSTYPYPISNDWANPYRNERIWQLLGDRTGLTQTDMTAIQTDVYSAFDQTLGQRIAYAVDHAAAPPKRLLQAANLLRNWDGRVTLEAVQPNITEATRTALWTLLLEPRLGKNGLALYTSESKAYALEMLVELADKRWLPAGYPDWNALLVAALERGLHDGHAPGRLADWHWGPTHAIALQHPIFGSTWYFRWLSGAEPQVAPLPGDAYTVRAATGNHGASERLVVDLAEPGLSTLTLPLGESGNISSPHFADQFAAWVAGRALPLTESSSSHQLLLVP